VDDRTDGGDLEVEVADDAGTAELTIRGVAAGNRLVIGAGTRFTGPATVTFRGTGSTVAIGQRVRFAGAIVVSNGASVQLGDRSTFGAVELVADVADITVGDDCMFSFTIELRTTDAHPLYDVATRQRVNPPRPIVIGDYVWVGKQVTILKGVTVGAGAAIALRSVVTKDVPRLCTAAGVPARVVRRGTIWTRHTKGGVLDDDVVAVGYLERLLAEGAPETEPGRDTGAARVPVLARAARRWRQRGR
jgi:polysialic-acid O-acetyltransferase